MLYEKKIIDNFLSKEENDNIFKVLTSNEFCWYFNSDTVTGIEELDNSMDTYFVHPFYQNFRPLSPEIDILAPIFNKLSLKALVRVKANLYPYTQEIRKHGFHIDQPYDLKSCLYYVNTNNGFTTFEDGTKVESVANRAVFFNSIEPHCSSTTSNSKFRITINFNYF